MLGRFVNLRPLPPKDTDFVSIAGKFGLSEERLREEFAANSGH
jgi:hypothetical protein